MSNISKNIEWLRSIIEEEICTSKDFFLDDMSKVRTDKGIKRLKKIYSTAHFNRLVDLSKLDENEIKNISCILEVYSSEVMKYFLKRLFEGELAESGVRQLFELNIVTEENELIESVINKDSSGDFEQLFGDWLISRFS